MSKISVAIATYNEEENIPKVISAATEALSWFTSDWEILFVESGSTDNSLKLIQEEVAHKDKLLELKQGSQA